MHVNCLTELLTEIILCKHIDDRCTYEAFMVASNMQQDKLDSEQLTPLNLLQTEPRLEALREGLVILLEEGWLFR